MVHISLNVGLLSSVTIMFQNGHFQDLYSLSHGYLGKIKTNFFLAPLIFRARQTAGYLIVNIFLKIPFQHPNFRSAAFPLHLLFSSQSLDQSSTTLSHGAAPGRNASLQGNRRRRNVHDSLCGTGYNREEHACGWNTVNLGLAEEKLGGGGGGNQEAASWIINRIREGYIWLPTSCVYNL